MLGLERTTHMLPAALPKACGTRHALPSLNLRAKVHRLAASQSTQTTTVEANTADPGNIYIGKGKFIKDDPKKYPSKDDMGPMLGATGGWAGGEKALLALKEELKNESGNSTSSGSGGKNADSTVNVKVQGKKVSAVKRGEGSDTVYVGFNKENMDDVEAKRRGEMGRFIVDDARKYPSREGVGPLDSVVGGFVGGEMGIKQFVADGEITFADESSRSQWSPLVVSSIVAFTATAGGILLTDAFDVGGKVFSSEILQAPIDDRTKLLLQIALGLLVVVWVGSGAFATFKALQQRLKDGTEGAAKVVVSGGFWLAVLFIAYQITQN